MIEVTINGNQFPFRKGRRSWKLPNRIISIYPISVIWKELINSAPADCVWLRSRGPETSRPLCLVPVREGMVIKTNTEKVRKARKVLYELILSDHPKDCLSCERNQSGELQEIGNKLGVTEARFEGERSVGFEDFSPSISRDMSKCILCRRCITVCKEIQGVGILNVQNRGFKTVVGPAMDLPLNPVNCAYCGECTVVCPVGALRETDAIRDVWKAIHDKQKRVVVQVAPAIRAAIGEEFDFEPGTLVTGKLASALRD